MVLFSISSFHLRVGRIFQIFFIKIKKPSISGLWMMGEVNSEISCLLVDFSSFSTVQRMTRSEECKIGQEKLKGPGKQREWRLSEHRCDTETPVWPRSTQEYPHSGILYLQWTLAFHPLLLSLVWLGLHYYVNDLNCLVS